MQFGVSIFPTDYSMPPADLGKAVEDRGFESLWVAEHSHIPLSRTSPWPGGSELPKMYFDAADPFVTLSFAAAATTALKIATGICLVVQRDPIQTAKEVASLDLYSGGRFLFGIGAGWNAEEMADHGTDFDRRFKVMRERIEAMKSIWADTKPEYHGEFVDFDPMMAWPKPTQQPHPPIHVGGSLPGAARRAARYGNGFIPIGGRGGSILDHLDEFRQICDEEGRDPVEIEITEYNASAETDHLERMRDGGIARAVFALPSAPATELLPMLDRYSELIDRLR